MPTALAIGDPSAVGGSGGAPPLLVDVDPVLVGIIVVLLLIIFAFFLLVRKTLLNFSDGMREGRRR